MEYLFLPLQEPVKKSGKSKKSKKKKKKKTSESEGSTKSKKDSTSASVTSRDSAAVPAHNVKAAAASVELPVKNTTPKYDLFEGHELKPREIKPVIRENRHQDWFPILTIFIVFLFSLINLFYQKKFRTFLMSLFKRSTAQGNREDNVFAQRLKVLLFILFALITASFFYQAGMVYEVKPSKLTAFQFFSVILFIVFFNYLGKFLVVRVMGSIFKTEKEKTDYSNNILLFLNILAFGLFPLVVLIGFTPGMDAKMLIKTGCVFILAAILFRIGRGYIMAVSNPLLSKFYLFVYLCTLEILPLVVIFKLFVDQFL